MQNTPRVSNSAGEVVAETPFFGQAGFQTKKDGVTMFGLYHQCNELLNQAKQLSDKVHATAALVRGEDFSLPSECQEPPRLLGRPLEALSNTAAETAAILADAQNTLDCIRAELFGDV